MQFKNALTATAILSASALAGMYTFSFFFHLFFFICLFPHKSRVDSWSSSLFSFFFVDYWAFFHRSRVTRTDNAKKKNFQKRKRVSRSREDGFGIFFNISACHRIRASNETG